MKTKGSTRGQAPERWTQGGDSGDEAQDQLARLLRAGDPAVQFDAARRARVLRRLRRPAASRWVGMRFSALRWAVAAIVLMTSGGVITAATLGGWWAPIFRGQDGQDDEAPPSAAPARRLRPARSGQSGRGRVPGADQPVATPDHEPAQAAALWPYVPEEEPPSREPVPPTLVETPPVSSSLAAPSAAATPEGARVLALVTPAGRAPTRPGPRAPAAPTSKAPAAPSSKAPAAPSSTPPLADDRSPDVPLPPTRSLPSAEGPPSTGLSGESRLLGRAVIRLRQDHDARGALAAVDDYRSRFPAGTLAREASVVQVDALLMLKRGDEALEILRGLALQPHGRDQELRIIRGELSAARDCQGAIADFDRILLQGPRAALMERALHGRAACRLRLGDVDGALADVDLYLRQYPDGRFAAEARRAKDTAGGGR